jgi:FAD/FMN-containing dehydrogenase
VTPLPPPPRGFRGSFLTSAEARDEVATHSGILHVSPAAVARPADGEDLATLVRWAAAHGVPLVPRGAGTGMPGGCVGPGVVVAPALPPDGGIHVDAPRRRAEVHPAVVLAALDRACAPVGLHFPVDPSSADRATLGGILANNAAGAHGVRYGAARRWTRTLDVVLADGARVRTARGERPRSGPLASILDRVDAALGPRRDAILAAWPRVRKNSSGYALREYLESGDAVDLLVGSEGTLGILAGATLDLAPLPAARGLAVLEFTSLEAAGAAVERILALGVSACELLDRTFVERVRSAGEDAGYPLAPGLEAILLVEVEGDGAEEVRGALEALSRGVRGIAARVTPARNEDERARFWALRHAASPLIARMAGSRVSMQFIEDGVVPVERLPEYVRLLRATLERHDLPAVIFGHAGDGNLHVNPLVDVTRAGWREQAEAILEEVAAGIRALGGTLAGEHGDGRIRAPLLEAVWGAEMVALFRAVKEAFDPAGILNPGTVLPLPGQRPLDGVRGA